MVEVYKATITPALRLAFTILYGYIVHLLKILLIPSLNISMMVLEDQRTLEVHNSHSHSTDVTTRENKQILDLW